MMATLLLSRGTPMLLAGDEFGQSQQGNNNAYAQDNETTWLDWSLMDDDPDFTATVKALIGLRKDLPALRRSTYEQTATSHEERFVSVINGGVACLLNASDKAESVQLPDDDTWRVVFASSGCELDTAQQATLNAQSVAVLVSG